MEILVIGANGQLGQQIKEISGFYNDHTFLFTGKQDLDITNFNKLNVFLSSRKIQYIINCSAYTYVDKAESEKTLAYNLNVVGPKNLAILSKKYNIKLIHISTDFVFNGKNNIPYKESDKTHPLSIYGITKLGGEKEIIKNTNKFFILRIAWLYSTYRNNFLKTIIKLAKEKQELNIIFDQIGTPTYAKDLAKIILDIVSKDTENYGIYNYSNEGVASWYDFAKQICKLSNVQCKINPIETKNYSTPAKRPNYSVLNKEKIKTTFNIEIPYWQDSLEKCIQSLE